MELQTGNLHKSTHLEVTLLSAKCAETHSHTQTKYGNADYRAFPATSEALVRTTTARKSLLGGFTFLREGNTIVKFDKTPLSDILSYFNLRKLEVCLWERNPPQASRRDGTRFEKAG